MTEFTTYKSYHGSGMAKAILFYWPGTSEETARSLEDELGNMDWSACASSSDRAYQKTKWLREKLGAPIK